MIMRLKVMSSKGTIIVMNSMVVVPKAMREMREKRSMNSRQTTFQQKKMARARHSNQAIHSWKTYHQSNERKPSRCCWSKSWIQWVRWVSKSTKQWWQKSWLWPNNKWTKATQSCTRFICRTWQRAACLRNTRSRVRNSLRLHMGEMIDIGWFLWVFILSKV